MIRFGPHIAGQCLTVSQTSRLEGHLSRVPGEYQEPLPAICGPDMKKPGLAAGPPRVAGPLRGLGLLGLRCRLALGRDGLDGLRHADLDCLAALAVRDV